MILLTATVVALLFGAGAHLMMRNDVFRLVAGTVLIVNAAVLLLVSSGFGADLAPILPVTGWRRTADPLVQALALTVVVISFGTTVLLLRLVVGVVRDHGSVALDDLMAAEVAEGEAEEEEPAGESTPGPGEGPTQRRPPT